MNPPCDARRAARRSAAQWQALIERFEREGQTRRRFCAAHGLALSTFDLWRRKLRAASAQSGQEAEALFVELSGAAVERTRAPSWEVELELGAGVVLRVRRAAPC